MLANRTNTAPYTGSGLAAAAQHLQTVLFSLLPWVQHAYGLAEDGYTLQDNVSYKQPEVYVGNGRYAAVLPNSQIVSQLFLCADGDEELVDFTHGSKTVAAQCDVSIVVWVNLDALKAAMGYAHEHRYTDELVAETLDALSTYFGFVPSTVVRKASEVWRDWDLSIVRSQTFKHPESGFRIKGTLHYDKPCITAP